MLDYPCSKPIEFLHMLFEFLIVIFNFYFSATRNILTDLWNTKASLVEFPFITRFIQHFRVNKNAAKFFQKFSFLFRELGFIFFFLIVSINKRECIYHKQADRFSY